MELLNFELKNPEAVTHAKFFTTHDLLLLSRFQKGLSTIQQIHLDGKFRVKKMRELKVENID